MNIFVSILVVSLLFLGNSFAFAPSKQCRQSSSTPHNQVRDTICLSMKNSLDTSNSNNLHWSVSMEQKRELEDTSVIHVSSRSKFVVNSFSSILAAVVLGSTNVGPTQAWAETDSKGTKKDPVFESCLSKCMYACTKPKGDEQKSRSECLPECKKSCATTKAQLLIGDPIKK